MDKSDINVMLDLETLGLGPDALVLSIGACVFDLEKGLGDRFYIEIDPKTSTGEVDIDTIKFWMKEATKGNLPPMDGIWCHEHAFTEFYNWLQRKCDFQLSNLIIWTNGTDFDIPKCKNPPWKYSNVRDARTIFKLFSEYGLKPLRQDHHNALADAEWQAVYLTSILKNLKETVNVQLT